MSRITRKPYFIFANGASNNGVFGSAQDGSKILSSDPSVIQGVSMGAPSTAYENGWNDATISGQQLPTLEEMQGLQYVQAYMQAYLFQEGIPEWENNTTYYQFSIVKKIGTYQLYGSLIDNNTGNALPSAVSNSDWEYLGDLSTLASNPNNRIRLSGNANYYVATTGNDSNPGTSGSPWLTIQHAVSWIAKNIDTAGFNVTVNIANGTYSENVSPTQLVANGTLIILGNTGSPSSVLISPASGTAIFPGSFLNLIINGVKLVATGANASCIQTAAYAYIQVENIVFGTASMAHVYLDNNSNYNFATGSYTIAGNATYHIFMLQNSTLYSVGTTMTLTGTPAFSSSFIYTQYCATAQMNLMTFSGSATGARYTVNTNSVIETGAGGASYFPGNASGTTANGGQYV